MSESLKITESGLEAQARLVLTRLLGEAEGSTFEIQKRESRGAERFIDFVAKLDTPTGLQTIAVDVKVHVGPKDLDHLLLLARLVRDRDTIPLLVSPYLSESVREACRANGLSWADLAGNCDIRFPGFVFKVSGNPNPYARPPGTRSLFSPRAARVVHALLLEPQRPWKTETLAERTGVSLGQVSNVRKLLEARNWINASYGHLTLTDPHSLLEAWRGDYRPQRKESRFFTLDPISEFEKRLRDNAPNYALTEFSAAERYAPFVRYRQAAFYVPLLSPDLLLAAGLREGDGATNVTVYESDEVDRFVEIAADAHCVSPILTYLDLTVLTGRGQDAAQHLLETTILPRWA